MFPVSGAELLQASLDNKARPMISHSGAYSSKDRPRPLRAHTGGRGWRMMERWGKIGQMRVPQAT